jgi:hypothetical protein
VTPKSKFSSVVRWGTAYEIAVKQQALGITPGARCVWHLPRPIGPPPRAHAASWHRVAVGDLKRAARIADNFQR